MMNPHDPFTRTFWTFWFFKSGNTTYGVSFTNHGIQFKIENRSSTDKPSDSES
ncbi:hypothetical protein Poly51_58210 [Rubripirellula tenax]|uniref:Uncharacterized protein n=1 Tax=Rubripirellula tenax TaxID=2528015 RepID=A0A5C6E8B6_9BACT|nr:hypothetical protein Poly51_58210 [Rubripirellula tenax]